MIEKSYLIEAALDVVDDTVHYVVLMVEPVEGGGLVVETVEVVKVVVVVKVVGNTNLDLVVVVVVVMVAAMVAVADYIEIV